MQKSHRISGLTGGVALCALVAVLGVPFFTHQLKDILGEESTNISRIGGASNVKSKAGATALDIEYEEAIKKENEVRATAAEKGSGSSMPIPIGRPNEDALSIPPAQKAEAGDPLQEWRAKAEAKRLSLEGEAAPSSATWTPMSGARTAGDGRVLNQAPAEELAKIQGKEDTGRSRQNAQAPLSEADRAYAPQKQREAEAKKSKDSSALYDEKSAGNKLARRADKTYGGPAQDRLVETKPSGSAGAIASESVAAPQLSISPFPRPEPVVVQPVAPPVPVDYYQQSYQPEGRDAFPNFEDNPVKNTAAEPVSTFSIDVDTASYSFIRRVINQGQMPPKGAVRLEELINYFPYDYALPGKDEDPFRPTVAVYKCPWTADHKIVHIGLKGYDLTEKPKTNMVFLIDTSGSMNSSDRLPLAISSFKLALETLKADDTVGIVTYAGSSGVVLEPTRVGEKQKIIDALDHLRSGGSTAGAAGIQGAYGLAAQAFVKEGNNRVILATDGDFNVGISDPEELKNFIAKKRSDGIFLSVLGFGRGNYQDTTMQALAQNGNGNAAYIDNLSEARKVLVQEAGATMFTIAKDVKIQVEFNPAIVQEYRLIGYETRHLNREDFNNDKIDAGEIGAGHAVTAIYEITPVGATAVVDNLRYGATEKALVAGNDEDKSEFNNELAFLKMRYKRPDSNTSVLMTRPITSSDEQSFESLPDDIRFASSVAGFGQLLRDSQYTGDLTWDKVIETANGARGKDEFGYRAEFVNLLRLAKSQSGQK